MRKLPVQKPGHSKQDYGTPQALIEAICNKLWISEFVLDVAADENVHVCDDFYTEEDNGLAQAWAEWGWNWCNPPFENVGPWVEKAYEESLRGCSSAVLVPASFANWWMDWVDGKAYINHLHGRITFVGETKPYPKDCSLLLYTPWGFRGEVYWSWR